MNLHSIRQTLREKFKKVNSELTEENFILNAKKKFTPVNSILVVDQDSVSNNQIKNHINRIRVVAENSFQTVTTGQEGLHFLKEFSFIDNNHIKYPLLILIDINISDMDGIDFLELANFCNFIQKESVKITFLINSKNDISILKNKGYSNYNFISKPITIEKMFDILSK